MTQEINRRLHEAAQRRMEERAAGEKRCSKCDTVKSLSDFYKDTSTLDRLTASCKSCRNSAYSKWRDGNRAQARHNSRKYQHGNVAHTIHTFVSYHIKKGHIVRPAECSVCGKKTVDIHAHHDDYTKRFDITWACRPCHKKIHREVAHGH